MDVSTPIRACASDDGATPCWRAAERSDCPKVCDPSTGLYQQVGVVIDRGGQAPPANSTSTVSCQILHPIGDPNAACVQP